MGVYFVSTRILNVLNAVAKIDIIKRMQLPTPANRETEQRNATSPELKTVSKSRGGVCRFTPAIS